MNNKLTVKAKYTVEVPYVGSKDVDIVLTEFDYQPGDIDSMVHCINETQEELNKLEPGVFSEIRIYLRRENDTIIDELNLNDIQTTQEVIHKMCII